MSKMLSVIILVLFNSIQFVLAQLPYPFDPLTTNDYFKAYLFLKDHEKQYIENDPDSYFQAMETLYAFMGKYNKVDSLYQYRDTVIRKHTNVKTEVASFKCVLTYDNLESLCNEYDVVVLNEAHFKSSDRAILFYLLAQMKKLGFKFLASEALMNDEGLKSRGYPLYNKTGFYTNDPIYAQAIRKAIDLGFELIPYDYNTSDSNRYEEQAKNILRQVNLKEGKLLVFGGYFNICENPKYLGYFLKKGLNKEILTISQVLPNNLAVNLSDKDSCFLINSALDCCDYFLCQPKSSDSLNIPGWYHFMDYHYELLSKFYQKDIVWPSLIQLFNKNEFDGGVPVFQYIIEKESEKNILLGFPENGDYKMIVTSRFSSDSLDINYK